MKKFTLSHTGDSDSSRSAHSLQGSNDVQPETELPRITVLNILFPNFGKKTCLKVIGDAVLLDIKRKLLKAFGSLLADGPNMGLFLPGTGGKLGKFLEEERLLSEYACEKPEIFLEFIYKRRMVPPVSITSPLVEKFSKDLNKAFLRYVARGDHKKVEKILSKGFDPNFQCPKTGETPLTIAVTRTKPYSVISALIAGGAHRDYYSKSGMTPLHKAAASRNFEAVKTLLDFGQSPNCRDRGGLTPLYVNILCDPDKRICHRLLYEHSELGVANREGLQEIHQAARLNRVEQINLLVMYGADVNSRCVRPSGPLSDISLIPTVPLSTSGDTPLHVAASAGQREAVLRLLSWGADPTLVNLANQTAVQLAQACGHAELAETIRLFRGDSEDGAYGGTFLPTPTYNPRRRMHNPPANSYITDPTALVETEASATPARSTITASQMDPSMRTAFVSHSFDRRMDRTDQKIILSPMDSNTSQLGTLQIPGSPLLRAVSMGELVHREQSKGLSESVPLDGVWRQSHLPSAECHSFLLATRPQYDSTNANGVPTSCTLARRPKQSTRTSAIYAELKPREEGNLLNEPTRRYASVQTPDFVKLLGDGPRHLHRFHQGSGNAANKSTLQSWKSTDKLHECFQREGSQTDSGISNSSADKRSITSPTSPTDLVPATGGMNSNQNPVFTKKPYQLDGNKSTVCTHLHGYRSLGDGLLQASSPHSPRGRLSPSSNPLCTSCNRAFRPGVPHTVVLYKTDGVTSNPKDVRPSFGLSIRTVKNSSMIVNFTPTANKPSLQVAKRIIPNSPADRAGICEGDFVLKINGVDVTRSTLEEVVHLLASTVDNSVCLTVMRPINPADGRRSADTSRTRAPTESSSSQNGMSLGVQSSGQCLPSRELNQPPHTFVRPGDTSQPPSARSSDRTTCSSIPDDGMWSQSTGPSSTDASARNSLISRPRNLDAQVTLVPALRSSMDQKMLSPDCIPSRVRFRGLPRSRTTTGFAAAQTNQQIPQSISQSLYFARNPRFRRVGSQDSQSSMSSGGGQPNDSAEGPSAGRKPVTRSAPGIKNGFPSVRQPNVTQNMPTNKFFPIDSTQIRITRDQLRPMQRTAIGNTQQQHRHQQQQQEQQQRLGGSSQYRQRSVQPPMFRNEITSVRGVVPLYPQNLPSRADTPSTAVESLTDSEIVLPPPIQFRG